MQGLIGIFFVNFSLLFLSSVLVFLDRVRKKEKRLWLDWGGAGVLFLWWLWFIILTFIGVITGFFEWKWWQTATIYLGSLIWGSVVFFVGRKGGVFVYLLILVPFLIYISSMFVLFKLKNL